MASGSKSQQNGDWLPTQAKVTACKQTLLGQENRSSEGYIPAEHRGSFSYLVNGQRYDGSYGANSPQECGRVLEILYDPKNPSRNTGSDVLNNTWIKWGARILGIGTALLAIWLCGDQAWFNN